MCSYSSLWIGYYGVIPNKLFWPKNQILQRPLEITNCSFFSIWFCIVLFLRQSLLLWSWLSWNWICKPRWPWTHRGVPVSTFWVLGLKVLAHHIPFPFFKMQLSKIKFRNLIKTYVITQKEKDRQTSQLMRRFSSSSLTLLCASAHAHLPLHCSSVRDPTRDGNVPK